MYSLCIYNENNVANIVQQLCYSILYIYCHYCLYIAYTALQKQEAVSAYL